MKAAALLSLLALTACAGKAEPVIRTVTVTKPVTVDCVPKSLTGPPSYPDTDKAIKNAAGPGDMLQLLAAGRVLRQQRLAEVEPVLSACRRPPDPG